MTVFHQLHEIKAPFQTLLPTLFKYVSKVENLIKIPEGEMPIRSEDAKVCSWVWQNRESTGTDTAAGITGIPLFSSPANFGELISVLLFLLLERSAQGWG